MQKIVGDANEKHEAEEAVQWYAARICFSSIGAARFHSLFLASDDFTGGIKFIYLKIIFKK